MNGTLPSCHPPTCTFSEDPPILADRSGLLSYEVAAFPLGFGVHEALSASSKSVLFPPVLWNSWAQTPLTTRARSFGGSSSHWQTAPCPQATPSIGSLMWGSELLILWENFCVIIIFQFVGCSHGMYGIWFYHDYTPPTILLWLILCLWTKGIFLVDTTVLLLMVIQQLVVFWCFYKKR